MKALVALELNRLSVEEVSIDRPRAGEALIRMKAAGVCHSDLSVANGTVPMPLPMVLGHEGAGVVAGVGPGVTYSAPGDHVEPGSHIVHSAARFVRSAARSNQTRPVRIACAISSAN